ncbi:polysaccharide deacetylase [Beggiatoa sp. PS]|nr:polysaccharide deacetylase [Beggiatoa sp. PS]
MKSYHFFLISLLGYLMSIALYSGVIASPVQNSYEANNAYQTYIKKGNYFNRLGRTKKAYNAYLKAYDNAVTHAQKKTVLGSLAVTSFSLRKRTESEQYLSELLSIFPDNTWAKQFAAKNNLKVKPSPTKLFQTKDRDPGGTVKISPVVKNSYKKKHALVIGINAYPTMPLEAAVADATAVSDRLKELNFEVTRLINHEASKYRIQSELGRLARTTEDEQVLIYFAGHGVTERLYNNQLEGYILPVDVDLKDLYATAISMEELRDLTRRIPAKHILYVFDSCYSGLGLTRATTTYTSQKYLATLAGKRAVYMITAGKAGEVAREVGRHGIFTLNLLEGIAGAADTNPKDNVVQASELGVYLARTVSEDTENEQNPQHGLLEGDGDFLFTLQDDDPIRLRELQLAKLERQTQALKKRQDLQTEFDRIQKQIEQSGEGLTEKADKKIAALDEQIKKKQAELNKLSQTANSIADLNRSPYSVMRFLNTEVEFNILKTFPNLEMAEEYYSNVFGMVVDLDKNGYKKDDKRKILLSREPAKLLNAEARSIMDFITEVPQQVGLSGIIDIVFIETVTMSDVLKEIKHVSSPLRNDHTTFVKSIHLIINKIDQKSLTFDQIKASLIEDYKNPTLTKESQFKVIDWKTGQFQPSNEFIWEDNKVRLLLRAVSDKDYLRKEVKKGLIEENLMTLEEYNEWVISTAAINISLWNHSSILKSFYKQAYKIAELEELVREKKAKLEHLNFR